jgi:hypothetical protein
MPAFTNFQSTTCSFCRKGLSGINCEEPACEHVFNAVVRIPLRVGFLLLFLWLFVKLAVLLADRKASTGKIVKCSVLGPCALATLLRVVHPTDELAVNAGSVCTEKIATVSFGKLILISAAFLFTSCT